MRRTDDAEGESDEEIGRDQERLQGADRILARSARAGHAVEAEAGEAAAAAAAARARRRT